MRALKHRGKTITAVETCCGGTINSGILAQPGASAVYFGGSVAYGTERGRKLLLDDAELHDALCRPEAREPLPGESEADAYVRSKLDWTARVSVARGRRIGSRGGAAGWIRGPQLALLWWREAAGRSSMCAYLCTTHDGRRPSRSPSGSTTPSRRMAPRVPPFARPGSIKASLPSPWPDATATAGRRCWHRRWSARPTPTAAAT